MRLVFVADQLDVGGAEQQLVTLCAGLARRGHDISVISIFDRVGLRPMLDAVGVPVHIAGKHGKYDLSTAWRLRTRINQIAPDLIHAYLPAASFLTPLTRWLGVRAPILQSERGINDWRSSFRLRCDTIVRRNVVHITCNAEAIRRHLIGREGVPARKISVIYNGLRDDRLRRPAEDDIAAARALIGAPANARIITCVANFSAVKQHDVLLHAFARARAQAPELFLLLVGSGELETAVRRQITQLGLDSACRVVTDCTNPAALLCASHIAVLASLLEGCSNALLEAMAMGLPVVASDTGGNPELVKEGGGSLFPVGDVAAFAAALLDLARTPAKAVAMGEYNRRRVLEHFTDEAMVTQTLLLYERILAGVLTPATAPDAAARGSAA